ncbi:hypothetical protein Tco_0199076 [Tanacetum coccineum]
MHPDVSADELCPPNKRYDLMDANKKVDLEHVQSSSSVPWIYMAQFWHTLKEDKSKYRLRFMLDKKELTLTLDDFRQIFHLPQATANNHNAFVPPPSFSDMVSFYKQVLRFTMELKTQSNFKTTGLLQTWKTLCKIFSKCLTTRVTGWDQPPLQIMQMLYCFVNNIYVDYAKLLWEGLYYSLHLRFRRHKNKVGMKIPDWMITDEMKQTEHYRMYMEVFGIDVPLTQSQPTESTRGTHRKTSAPRSPNPDKEVTESSAPSRSTVIRLRLPERKNSSTDRARSDKEKSKMEIAKEKDVEIISGTKRQKAKEQTERLIAKAILQERRNIQAQILTQIENTIANVIHSQVDASVRNYMSGHILYVHPTQSQHLYSQNKQYQLVLKVWCGNKADPRIQQQRHSNMHDMFSIIYEPVHGIIYKNSKKEKRVMRHTEIHKFCDATLNRVLEGLKSYNNDVKYGYVQKDLTKDETEYLKLFEEEIEERLKHRRQMRRWEMYVNGRPLGLRREHPE